MQCGLKWLLANWLAVSFCLCPCHTLLISPSSSNVLLLLLSLDQKMWGMGPVHHIMNHCQRIAKHPQVKEQCLAYSDLKDWSVPAVKHGPSICIRTDCGGRRCRQVTWRRKGSKTKGEEMSLFTSGINHWGKKGCAVKTIVWKCVCEGRVCSDSVIIW